MTFGSDKALPIFATFIRTVKHWVMFWFKVWCTLNRHGSIHIIIGGVDLGLAKPKRLEHIKLVIA